MTTMTTKTTTTTKTNATIYERGNGLPDVGDVVVTDAGEPCMVVALEGRIETGSAGQGDSVRALVVPADWDEVDDSSSGWSCRLDA